MESAAKMDHSSNRTCEVRETFDGPRYQHAYKAARMYAVNAAFLLETFRSEHATKYAAVDADQAMARLTEAVALGFMDAERLKIDPDLDVLRRREDFQKLIAALEKKSADGETKIEDQ